MSGRFLFGQEMGGGGHDSRISPARFVIASAVRQSAIAISGLPRRFGGCNDDR